MSCMNDLFCCQSHKVDLFLGQIEISQSCFKTEMIGSWIIRHYQTLARAGSKRNRLKLDFAILAKSLRLKMEDFCFYLVKAPDKQAQGQILAQETGSSLTGPTIQSSS